MDENKSRNKLKADRYLHGLCVYCGQNPNVENKKGCEICLNRKSQSTAKYVCHHSSRVFAYRQMIRLEVIEKYGNKCACCGCDNKYFLVIDHKNNDGGEERRELYKNKSGASSSWYLKLRREPVRDDLQVLCHNCNMARSLYGKCPHQSDFVEPDLSILNIDNRRNKKNFNVGCKIKWPDDDELLAMVKATNCSRVARDLGVHDTAVRGRLKRRNLYRDR
jgi:hypothetical protein